VSAFLTGIVLGFAGSAHCALMCGPFAAIVAPKGRRAVLHHISRIATYVTLGFLAGAVGTRLVAGPGRWLALVAAAVLLAQAIWKWRGAGLSRIEGRIGAVVTRAIRASRSLSGSHPTLAGLVAGALNGLLPCGFVYAAVVASLGAGSSVQGALVMAGFGAGTTPALATMAGSLDAAGQRLQKLRALAPAALIVVAILMAARAFMTPGTPHVH
jgi:sulfite exporter TauE/SafE